MKISLYTNNNIIAMYSNIFKFNNMLSHNYSLFQDKQKEYNFAYFIEEKFCLKFFNIKNNSKKIKRKSTIVK